MLTARSTKAITTAATMTMAAAMTIMTMTTTIKQGVANRL
jgi:hypothetical protein